MVIDLVHTLQKKNVLFYRIKHYLFITLGAAYQYNELGALHVLFRNKKYDKLSYRGKLGIFFDSFQYFF